MTDMRSLSKLRRLCTYGSWFLILATIVSALGLFVLSLGVVVCIWYPDAVPASIGSETLLIQVVSLIVPLISCLFGCLIGNEIVESVIDEGTTPFTQENVHRMRVITGLAFTTFLIDIIVQLILYLTFRPEDFFGNISVGLLLIGILTYAFSLVFEYGTVLQTESDEFL